MIRSVSAWRIGLAAIAIASTMAVAAPAANANVLATHIQCVLTGAVGSLTPGIPIGAGGVQQDGLYTLTGTATCTTLDPLSTPETTVVNANIVANGYYTNTAVGNDNFSGAGCMWANQDPSGEVGTTPCPALPTGPVTPATLTDYFKLSAGGTTGNMRFGFGIDFAGGHARLHDFGGGGYGPATEAAQTGPDAYHLWGMMGFVAGQLPAGPVTSFTLYGAFDAES